MSAKRRHAVLLVLAMVVALLGSVLATGVAAARPLDLKSHNRYIVQVRPRATIQAVGRSARVAGANIVGRMSAINSLVVKGSRAEIRALARDPRVARVIPDRVEQIVPPETSVAHKRHKPKGNPGGSHGRDRVEPDPAFDLRGLMWNFDRIDAQRAWRETTGRPSVLVGITDTGLDYTHSELATQVVDNVSFTDPTVCKVLLGGGVSDADLAAEFGGPEDTDWNGHGSWIGGNIAGALDGVGINGIAPKVGLVALKISEWCGAAFDSAILEAYQYAADNDIDVVSTSFGGYLDRSDPEQDALYEMYADMVKYGMSKGTTYVASAGNEHVRLGRGGQVISHGPLTIPGDPFDDLFGLYEVPGGIPGVVMVSATGNVTKGASATCATGTFETTLATCKPASDRHQPIGVGRRNQLAYYSNYGPRIDVAAPGGARKFNLPGADRGGTVGWPFTTADGTTAFETFSITSNWATQIPCALLTGPDFYPNECYSTIQGTSMSAPHASAVLALIASEHRWARGRPFVMIWYLKRTADDIRGNRTTALSATDTSPGDLTGVACPTGYCHLGNREISDRDAYGAGLVNAEDAVR